MIQYPKNRKREGWEKGIATSTISDWRKKQINDSNQSQQRNVSVIQDIDGNSIVVINDIRFKGKRSIDWKEVRAYLKEYVGDFYKVASTGIWW